MNALIFKKIKLLCYAFMLCFLLVNMYSFFIKKYEIAALKGSYQMAPKPQWIIVNWFDKTFQQQTETWLNQNFVFRNTLVRLHNQIGYQLYKKPYANEVVIGKNGYLFAQNYIDAYTGKDFIGSANIKSNVNRIILLQKLLQSKNIALICAIAPGKASFCHEYLNEEDTCIVDTTNYSIYTKEFINSGIAYIDFKSWFDYLKAAQPYALFPATGIHWSTYGALLAADSLIKKVAQVCNTAIPNLIIKNVTLKKELSGVDNDIGEGMNLLIGPPVKPMPYADYEFNKNKKGKKPRVLVVADSYYFTLPIYDLRKEAFDGVNFLYYNKELHPMGPAMIPLEKVKLDSLLDCTDLVFMLSTEANLKAFDWNFSNDVLAVFINQLKPQLLSHLQSKSGAKLLHSLKIEAISKGITLDSLESLYVLLQKARSKTSNGIP